VGRDLEREHGSLLELLPVILNINEHTYGYYIYLKHEKKSLENATTKNIAESPTKKIQSVFLESSYPLVE